MIYMIKYEYLFHGTTEGYIDDRIVKNSFVSTDRYTSKPIVAISWAKSKARDLHDKMAIITLFDVTLDQEIESENQSSLSSRGIDIRVIQREIEEGKNPNIKGINIYREHEMEEFIRRYVKKEDISRLTIEDIVNFYRR